MGIAHSVANSQLWIYVYLHMHICMQTHEKRGHECEEEHGGMCERVWREEKEKKKFN